MQQANHEEPARVRRNTPKEKPGMPSKHAKEDQPNRQLERNLTAFELELRLQPYSCIFTSPPPLPLTPGQGREGSRSPTGGQYGSPPPPAPPQESHRGEWSWYHNQGSHPERGRRGGTHARQSEPLKTHASFPSFPSAAHSAQAGPYQHSLHRK